MKYCQHLFTPLPMNPLILGRVISAYGVLGWVKVVSFTEQSSYIFNYQPWLIKLEFKVKKIFFETWKHHNQDFIIKLQGISDRETARLLINSSIAIDPLQLPGLDSGEYYWKDVIGCQVITIKGYWLGEIINLIATGSNDVLIIRSNMADVFGIDERLIPFLEGQVIKHVNLIDKIINVDWDPSF